MHLQSDAADLKIRLQNSDYLAQLARRHPEIETPSPETAEQVMTSLLDGLRNYALAQQQSEQELRDHLQVEKARFVTAWAVADLSGALTTQELGRLQTSFAEACVSLVLRAAWQIPEHAKYLKQLPEPGGNVPGFFVLGLGKLGGADLNFSSDIDLLAFFDKDIFPTAPMQGPADVAARILKWVTNFLEDDDRQTFLWRVDWRLRPEASATQLAMSVTAALEYYYFRSLPWHRLAMMKARPIAGDIESANQFLGDMERFIWRQNLDFRAIDELASLKQRIDLEHPGLKRQRAQSQRITAEAQGFNLKLGTGGIREIEFLANALQLIWGGKKPQLRVTHTATALQRLAEEELIGAEVADYLVDTYWWLRRQENRLQLLGNQQIHSLPREGQSLQKFQRLADIESWDDFAGDLYSRRQRVHSEFASLFQGPDEEEHQADEEPDWPDLTEANQDIVEMWEQGFRGYGVPASQSVSLDHLYRELSRNILSSGRDVEESVQLVHAYFRRLPPGGQYFRLLQNSPGLVAGLVVPLLYSPPMRTLLEQTPHIIDTLLETSAEGVSPDDDFVFHSRDYETRLERMRRLVNEQLYRFYLDFLFGKLDPAGLQYELTKLAEYALQMALRVVGQQLGKEEAPVCIVGLGKLGVAKMAPLSDLDILYVSRADAGMEGANRFVNRLQTALATPMKEGVVYEMDTRLRPSGRSGPPTVGLESFSQYQMERAKTWEHQALVTARPVAGNEGAASEVMRIRREVLTRPREERQLMMDAAKMLHRLRQQRISDPGDKVIFTKHRMGGLMETEYLVSCAALVQCQRHPDWADLSYEELLPRVGESLGLKDLPEIIQFWRALQIWERLLGLEGRSMEQIPERFLDQILQSLAVRSVEELAERTASHAGRIVKALEDLLSLDEQHAKLLESWAEEPIRWRN